MNKKLIGLATLLVGLSTSAFAAANPTYHCKVQQITTNGTQWNTDVFGEEDVQLSTTYKRMVVQVPQFDSNYPNDKVNVYADVGLDSKGRISMQIQVTANGTSVAQGVTKADVGTSYVTTEVSSLQGVQFQAAMVCEKK